MENIIRDYLENNFEPMLAQFTVNDETIMKISNDVHSRLSSLLNRWNDSSFRSTILLHGVEEATHYVPEADIEIKALVTVAIRNSLLEDIASTKEAAKKFGLRRPLISDEQIKNITTNAIVFFNKQNFKSASYKTDSIESDPFGHLSTKFPLAWYVMHKLSQCSNYITFEVPNELRIAHSPLQKHNTSTTSVEVQSGMDPNIDPTLREILLRVKNGEQAFFFSDSFKMITRHPEKLYRVIEEVLNAKAPIVTFNYYISNGYVARRSQLLKVAHSEKDLKYKFTNLKGLRKAHLEIIKKMG
ncbi:hypothetical protein GCM10010912_61650 [Paenibacillus albidus]|uniref:Uncharacterized protein n=1 Tax=Paenibacillus albidus TaxID=2041023 RepID=A0A917D4X5_9BACL|nr:hypothetical protein [Paenibacillus albidus]GGG08752.1 hypothetical protein GCM10010912_61650 [Paenibacillus albidus]